MMRFPFIVSLSLVSLSWVAGCATTHEVPIAAGAYQVQFSAARFDSPPLTTEIVKEGGYEFVTETATFPYAREGDFENVEVVASVREKRGMAIQLEERALEGMLAAFRGALTARSARLGFDARCAAPGAVTASELGGDDLSGLAMTCRLTKGDQQQSMVVRALTSSQALVFQGASWTDEKGKAWSSSFLGSIRRSPSPPGPAAAGPRVQVSAQLCERAVASFTR